MKCGDASLPKTHKLCGGDCYKLKWVGKIFQHKSLTTLPPPPPPYTLPFGTFNLTLSVFIIVGF